MAEPNPDDIRDPIAAPFNVPFAPTSYADLAQTVTPAAPAPVALQPRGILPVGRPPTPAMSVPPPADAGLYKMRKIETPTPPKPQYSDPLMSLGEPLTLLAVLGSMFVRNPATAAINALAAAAEGKKAGDRKRYENSYKQYQQELEKAANEQREEQRLYEESYSNKRLALDARIAQMRVTALRRRDNVMVDALNRGEDPGAILAARLKAGKPVTEGMIKASAISEKMQKDTSLTFAQAAADYEKEKSQARTEGKPKTAAQLEEETVQDLLLRNQGNPNYTRAEALSEARTAKRGAVMSVVNAKDIEARMAKIKQQEPGISDGDARIKALDDHNLARGAPPGKAFGNLDPAVQNVVKAFPAAMADLDKASFKMSQPRQAQLMSALRVIKENDRVAQYVADNPDAVGVLPLIYNRMHSTLATKPGIEFTDPTQAATIALQEADRQSGEIRKLGGKTMLPDGRMLTPGLAERAAILNKMLIQTGLSDAAQMSASGRGGTIYLDKLMTEKIYNQATNPYVLMTFLADRSQPGALAWKELDKNIDFGSPDAPPEYRSELLSPQGLERLIAKAYPSKGPQPGTVMDGYRFKGGNPADKSNWERAQ